MQSVRNPDYVYVGARDLKEGNKTADVGPSGNGVQLIIGDLRLTLDKATIEMWDSAALNMNELMVLKLCERYSVMLCYLKEWFPWNMPQHQLREFNLTLKRANTTVL